MNIRNYFSVNRIVGLVSLIVFTLFVSFGSSLSVGKAILFFFLGLIISCVSFYLVNIAVPKDADESWLAIAPFIFIMALCSILGWDVRLPFLYCGFIAVGLTAAKIIAGKKDLDTVDSVRTVSTEDLLSVFKIMGLCLASSLLFTVVCAFVEVFI